MATKSFYFEPELKNLRLCATQYEKFIKDPSFCSATCTVDELKEQRRQITAWLIAMQHNCNVLETLAGNQLHQCTDLLNERISKIETTHD